MPTIVIYDQDVLNVTDPSKDTGAKLLRQAHKLHLIDRNQLTSSLQYNEDTFKERIDLLCPAIGWFGANLCFEDEVCSNGYFDVIVQTIRDEGYEQKLEKFLKENNLSLHPVSLSVFIQSQDALKIPVAHAVANAVGSVKVVPSYIASALRHSTLLSLGGIHVDEYFEIRTCATGFKEFLFKSIDDEGLTQKYEELTENNPQLSQESLLQHFFSKTSEGLAIRSKTKGMIADSVEYVGCSEFASTIRDTDFPPREE